MTGTNTNAMTIGAFGIRFLRGIWGVDPIVSNSAPLSSVGTPSMRILIAVPVTTWLASNWIHATACIDAMKTPAATAAKSPIHGLPA